MKAFLGLKLLPTSRTAHEQELLLGLATGATNRLTQGASEILKTTFDLGIHTFEGPCGFHLTVSGKASFRKLDPHPQGPHCLEPFSASDLMMRDLLHYWSRSGQGEEEGASCVSGEEAIPSFDFFVWLLSFFWGDSHTPHYQEEH